MALPQQNNTDTIGEMKATLTHIASDILLQKQSDDERDQVQLALVGDENPTGAKNVMAAIEKLNESIMKNNSIMSEMLANSKKSLDYQEQTVRDSKQQAEIERKDALAQRRQTIATKQEQKRKEAKESFLGRLGLVQERDRATPDGYRDEKGRFVRGGRMTPTPGAAMAAAGLGLGITGLGLTQVLSSGSDEMTATEQMRERTKGTGTVAGAGVGGVIGGILGSALGPLGTVVGAGLGSAVGGFIGNIVSGFMGPDQEDIDLEKLTTAGDTEFSETALELAARRGGSVKEGGVFTSGYATEYGIKVPERFGEEQMAETKPLPTGKSVGDMIGEALEKESKTVTQSGPGKKRGTLFPTEAKHLRNLAKKHEVNFKELMDLYLKEYPMFEDGTAVTGSNMPSVVVKQRAMPLIEQLLEKGPQVTGDDIKSPDDMMLEGPTGTPTMDEFLDPIKSFFGFETSTDKIKRLEEEKIAKREELLTTSMNADIAATNAARDLELFQENAGEMVQVGKKFNPLEGTYDPVMGYAATEDQQRYEELQKKVSEAKKEQTQATLNVVEYDLTKGASSEGSKKTLDITRVGMMLSEMAAGGVDIGRFLDSGPHTSDEAKALYKQKTSKASYSVTFLTLKGLKEYGYEDGIYFIRAYAIRDYYQKWKAARLSEDKIEKQEKLQAGNDSDDLGTAESEQPGFFESAKSSVKDFLGGIFGGGSDAPGASGDTTIDESAGDVDMEKSKTDQDIESMPPLIKRMFEEGGYDISKDADGNWSAVRSDESGKVWTYQGDGSYSISDDSGVKYYDKDGKFLYSDSPTVGGMTERTFADGTTEQTITSGVRTQKTRDGQVVGEQFSAGGIQVSEGELARSGSGTSALYNIGSAVSKYDSESLLGGIWEGMSESEGFTGKLASLIGSVSLAKDFMMGGGGQNVVAPTTNNTTNNVVNNSPMPPPKSPKSEDESFGRY